MESLHMNLWETETEVSMFYFEKRVDLFRTWLLVSQPLLVVVVLLLLLLFLRRRLLLLLLHPKGPHKKTTQKDHMVTFWCCNSSPAHFLHLSRSLHLYGTHLPHRLRGLRLGLRLRLASVRNPWTDVADPSPPPIHLARIAPVLARIAPVLARRAPVLQHLGAWLSQLVQALSVARGAPETCRQAQRRRREAFLGIDF